MQVNECSARGLVDSGCTRTIVHSKFVRCVVGESFIYAFDGRQVRCKGSSVIKLVIDGRQLSVHAVVSDTVINGVDVVIGLDVINRCGSVTIKDGLVQFLHHKYSLVAKNVTSSSCGDMNVCEIDDNDFHAVFDGKHWTVEWFWKNDLPVNLINRISSYSTN